MKRITFIEFYADLVKPDSAIQTRLIGKAVAITSRERDVQWGRCPVSQMSSEGDVHSPLVVARRLDGVACYFGQGVNGIVFAENSLGTALM